MDKRTAALIADLFSLRVAETLRSIFANLGIRVARFATCADLRKILVQQNHRGRGCDGTTALGVRQD
jgi:hypothetical protein